jgi:hypothetical protein
VNTTILRLVRSNPQIVADEGSIKQTWEETITDIRDSNSVIDRNLAKLRRVFHRILPGGESTSVLLHDYVGNEMQRLRPYSERITQESF